MNRSRNAMASALMQRLSDSPQIPQQSQPQAITAQSAGEQFARMLASQGRGGDSTIGHLTPGEITVPPEVLQKNPQLAQMLAQVMGPQFSDHVVGSPAQKINPNTGIPEFEGDGGGDGGNGAAGGDAGGAGGDAGAGSAAGSASGGSGNGAAGSDAGGAAGDAGAGSAAGSPSGDSGTAGTAAGNAAAGNDAGGAMGDAAAGSAAGSPSGDSSDSGQGGADGGGVGGGGTQYPYYDTSGNYMQGGPAPVGAAAGPTATQTPATPPPDLTYSDAPGFLNLNAHMTPLQIRTAIGTFGTTDSDSKWRDPQAQTFYGKYLNQNLRGQSPTAKISDLTANGTIEPTELNYLNNVMNLHLDPNGTVGDLQTALTGFTPTTGEMTSQASGGGLLAAHGPALTGSNTLSTQPNGLPAPITPQPVTQMQPAVAQADAHPSAYMAALQAPKSPYAGYNDVYNAGQFQSGY